jgi:Skp family chaperone for outer membrane proteins
MKRIVTILLALVFTFIAGAVYAADDTAAAPAAVKKWESMTDEEKAQLREIYSRSNEVSGTVDEYFDSNKAKFSDLTPDEKKKMEKAYSTWQKLSPQMKKTMKEKYEKWKELTPEQKKKIREAYKKYRSMTADEKAKLREEIKKDK